MYFDDFLVKTNDLHNLSIINDDKPLGLIIDEAKGAFTWSPSEIYVGNRINLVISACYDLNTVMYTATQTILIQVIDHSFPVLLRYSVPDSFKICVITLIEIDRDCYLNDSLEAILGLTPDISYTISPQNPKYYVDVESNLLT